MSNKRKNLKLFNTTLFIEQKKILPAAKFRFLSVKLNFDISKIKFTKTFISLFCVLVISNSPELQRDHHPSVESKLTAVTDRQPWSELGGTCGA